MLTEGEKHAFPGEQQPLFREAVTNSFWGGFRQIPFPPGVRVERQQNYEDKGSCRRGAASRPAVTARGRWQREEEEEEEGGFEPQAGLRGGFQRSKLRNARYTLTSLDWKPL